MWTEPETLAMEAMWPLLLYLGSHVWGAGGGGWLTDRMVCCAGRAVVGAVMVRCAALSALSRLRWSG